MVLRSFRMSLCAFAVAAVALLAGAATASAEWMATLTRASTNPSDPGLQLTASASAPSYGLNFALNQSGYMITAVTANQPGASFNGQPATACTPTNQSAATKTGNPGIDCSFAAAVSQVTITFTTSSRYPDNAGGQVYDPDDGSIAPVPGPAPAPVDLSTKTDIKAYARGDAVAGGFALALCPNESGGIGLIGRGLLLGLFYGEDCAPIARQIYAEALAAHDPVDQNFSAVALPSTFSVRTLGPAGCRGVSRSQREACRGVAALAAGAAGAAARLAAISAAVDTALNRFNTALADGSSTGTQTQDAALRAYDGELIDATAAENAADRALGRELRKLHLDFRLTRKQVAAGERAFASGHLPATLRRGLAAQGISAAAFAAALGELPRPPAGPLDFVQVLDRKQAPGRALTRIQADWRTLTGQDLSAIVSGLVITGAIGQPLAQTLDNDATRIDQAAPGTPRGNAVAQFVADSRGAAAEAATLLETAGRGVSSS